MGHPAFIDTKTTNTIEQMAITFQFWTENLLSAAEDIADTEHQASRWLATDAAAWERPAELLSVLLDDFNIELYIKENRLLLAEDQLASVTTLAHAALTFDVGLNGWRDAREVLDDPAWENLRCNARAFIASFQRAQD